MLTVFLLLFWIIPCPENHPGYRIQLRVLSVTHNNEQAKVVIYCISVLMLPLAFLVTKWKKLWTSTRQNKPTFQACFEYVREVSNITLKNPLSFPIRGLFWDCFFAPRNDLKKLPTATLRSVWCHKLFHFSTLPFSMTTSYVFSMQCLIPISVLSLRTSVWKKKSLAPWLKQTTKNLASNMLKIHVY